MIIVTNIIMTNLSSIHKTLINYISFFATKNINCASLIFNKWLDSYISLQKKITPKNIYFFKIY